MNTPINRTALDDQAKVEMFDKLAAILLQADWQPSARVIAAGLLLTGDRRAGYSVIDEGSSAKVGELVGVGARTTRETLGVFETAGVIQRKIDRTARNKHGEELANGYAVNKGRGDWYDTTVVLAMPLTLAGPLPELDTPENTKQAQKTVAKKAGRIRRIEEVLQKVIDHANTPCPHCSEGHLEARIGAVCDSCGSVLDVAELEALLATPRKSFPKAQTVPPAEKSAAFLEDAENFSVDTDKEGTKAGGALSPTPATMPQDIGDREILTGAATLDYLDGLGAALCLTDGKDGRKPCDDMGNPLPGNYLDMPQPLAVAVANVKRGAGAGMLTHLSNGLTLWDVDAGLDSLFAMFPGMAKAPRLFRDNAPDRGKLLIRMSDGIAGKIVRQDEAEPTRKAELLGRGHGNVAGLHPSGEPYKLLTGELLTFSRSEIETMLSQWIPNPYKPEGKATQTITPPLSAPKNSAATERGANDVNDAIDWWIKNNQADVLNAVSKLQGKSKYVALRADDKTPSAIRTDLKDGYGRATFRDFGSNETLDAFEIHCRLNSLVKRDEVIRVLAEWRMATTAETKAKNNVNRYGAQWETLEPARLRADLADLQNQVNP